MDFTKGTSSTAARLLTLALVACGGSPSAPPDTAEVAADTAGVDDVTASSAVPVDILWVLDASASMCNEQRSLTAALTSFAARLTSRADVDPRVAVTSQDALCEPDGVYVPASKGVFNTVAASAYPPPCQERRSRSCLDDAACANMDCVVRGECASDDADCTCDGALGTWRCLHPNTAECLENPNGTVNSTCVRRCTDDADCRALFGDDTYICQKPSANAADWGCVRPPLTAGCPEPLPGFVDATTLDLLPCLVSVPVNQEKCYAYQQGMKASLLALDRDGPNADQARAFLRDDAWLVVIYVSDDDDCSTADGATIAEDDYQRCASLATTAEDGPLLPVATTASRLRALVSDPGKVIVAAVAGDSTAADPEQAQADRAAYHDAMADPTPCYQQSYVCLSDRGPARFAARFRALSEEFGANGAFVNICGDAGPALDAVADHIIQAVTR